MDIKPTGDTLGATVKAIDLGQPLTDAAFRTILRALGAHGVLCFPKQTFGVDGFAAFGGRLASSRSTWRTGSTSRATRR